MNSTHHGSSSVSTEEELERRFLDMMPRDEISRNIGPEGRNRSLEKLYLVDFHEQFKGCSG